MESRFSAGDDVAMMRGVIARVIGVGAVSAAGLGGEVLRRAIVDRRSCLAPDPRFAGALVGAASACPVDRRSPRLVSFAVEAARQAVEARPPGRGALVLATTHGGSGFCQEFHDGFSSPLLFSASVHNAAASVLSERYRIQGPVHTLLAGGDGTAQAIETAAGILAEGLADWALAGAAEELNAAILAGYAAKGYRGTPAEGAAMFLLASGGRPLERWPSGPVRLGDVDVDRSLLGEAFAVTDGLLLAATWGCEDAVTLVGGEWLPLWGARPA